MNPFEQKPGCLTFENWNQLYPPKYDPHTVDPYTKCRIILMNGTEFEANWFSHQFARHTQDNDLRRTLAMSRRVEKQQQMKIANLKPGDEDILEHTIGYEQLAVDLTAAMARRETDPNLKRALNFALLEDFDHLYRYADLLEPGFEKAKRELGERAHSDEDVLSYIAFPAQAEAFFEKRDRKEDDNEIHFSIREVK